MLTGTLTAGHTLVIQTLESGKEDLLMGLKSIKFSSFASQGDWR